MRLAVTYISWGTRIITFFFAAFISIFALDVFDEGYSFGKTLLALLIHLLPAFIILLILFFSWKKEWMGGIAFLCAGIWYAIAAWGKIAWSGFVMIDAPLFILAILYFIVWFYKKQVTKHTHTK